ncbi:MAG TPA: PEGA domain-containing protein, partial [Calditrichaeota bacterium]|nr:PEGA domain-containing protein [Calditrichota bacterium]
KNYKKIFKILVPVILIVATLSAVVYYRSLLYPNKKAKPALAYLTLKVSSVPTRALVLINGDSLGRTPLQNHTIKAGTYTLHISKEKYEAKDTTVVLENEHIYELAFVLNPVVEKQIPVDKRVIASADKTHPAQKLVTLSVRSIPAGAELWLNGKHRGQTPFQQSSLKPGVYRLTLEKEGFDSFSKVINLKSGKIQKITAKLIPQVGALMIDTNPRGARVSLDGQEITKTFTPVQLNNIPVGVHQIGIHKDGYADYQITVKVEQGKTTIRNVNLLQVKGKLSIQVIPWGTIYINDQLQKSSSDVKYELELPVGEHTVKIVHPTFGQWQKKIHVSELKPTQIKINFNKKLPIIISATDKQGNEFIGDVYIDGEFIGKTTPVEVNLRIGLHRLIVKKTGYYVPDGEIEFLVDSDSEKKVNFLMEKIH